MDAAIVIKTIMKGILFQRAAGSVEALEEHLSLFSFRGLPGLPLAGASWGLTRASLDEDCMRHSGFYGGFYGEANTKQKVLQ